MAKQAIATTSAPGAIGPYSQAVQVGDYIFTSGQLGLIPETGHRITSYNVCYTKLLRDKHPDWAGDEHEQHGESKTWKHNCRQLTRITSYNVCYTKLLRKRSRC